MDFPVLGVAETAGVCLRQDRDANFAEQPVEPSGLKNSVLYSSCLSFPVYSGLQSQLRFSLPPAS